MSRTARLALPALLLALGGPLSAAADAESEVARGERLESEIEAELRRQEELLTRLGEEAPPPASPSVPSLGPTSLSERADPRAAPHLPVERQLPLAIFERETATIPEDTWGNEDEIEAVVRRLDADRDGKPEQIRYFDLQSGEMLRKEQDLDYDGDLDAWSSYEDGALVRRVLDTDDDQEPDVWEWYADDRMTRREVDRDQDGTRDAFYVYDGDSIVEERHDANNDGVIDLVVTYRNRLRTLAVEDLDRDGRDDSWTHYGVHGGEEVITRVEKDTDGSGTADVFETYEMFEGRPVLARREEDKTGDGEIDIVSIYRNGKLVKREISDPSLMPL